jgi:hypothetical protein
MLLVDTCQGIVKQPTIPACRLHLRNESYSLHCYGRKPWKKILQRGGYLQMYTFSMWVSRSVHTTDKEKTHALRTSWKVQSKEVVQVCIRTRSKGAQYRKIQEGRLLGSGVVQQHVSHPSWTRSLDSSVDRGIGVQVPEGSRIFSCPRRPDRLWGAPSVLSNGYRGLFPQE